MTSKEALDVLYSILKHQRLTDVQELVFCETWKGKSYPEIAANSKYEPDYIKFVGFQLWKLLSEVFKEKVTKNNLQSVFRRKAKQILEFNS